MIYQMKSAVTTRYADCIGTTRTIEVQSGPFQIGGRKEASIVGGCSERLTCFLEAVRRCLKCGNFDPRHLSWTETGHRDCPALTYAVTHRSFIFNTTEAQGDTISPHTPQPLQGKERANIA
jgi:hypothetical protein